MPQAGEAEFMSVARRPRRRMATDVIECSRHRADESERSFVSSGVDVVIDRFLDVPFGPLTGNDRLCCHPFAR